MSTESSWACPPYVKIHTKCHRIKKARDCRPPQARVLRTPDYRPDEKFKKSSQYVWTKFQKNSPICSDCNKHGTKKCDFAWIGHQASISLRLPQNSTQITKWNYVVTNIVTQCPYHQHYPLCVTGHSLSTQFWSRWLSGVSRSIGFWVVIVLSKDWVYVLIKKGE